MAFEIFNGIAVNVGERRFLNSKESAAYKTLKNTIWSNGMQRVTILQIVSVSLELAARN
jgi:hypothetical protein